MPLFYSLSLKPSINSISSLPKLEFDSMVVVFENGFGSCISGFVVVFISVKSDEFRNVLLFNVSCHSSQE